MSAAFLELDLSTLEHEQCQGLGGLVGNSPEHQIMANFPAEQSGEQKTPCWWREVKEI